MSKAILPQSDLLDSNVVYVDVALYIHYLKRFEICIILYNIITVLCDIHMRIGYMNINVQFLQYMFDFHWPYVQCFYEDRVYVEYNSLFLKSSNSIY